MKLHKNEILISNKNFKVSNNKINIEMDNITSSEFQKYDLNQSNLVLKFVDKRIRTSRQNNFIHALIADISQHTGDLETELKDKFKYRFAYYFELEEFNTHEATVTQANQFILMLLLYAMEFTIPLSKRPAEYLEDEYLYQFEKQALLNKQCVICGQKADVHHYTTVGRGFNRETINHVGMKIGALCRIHHTEYHSMPESEFLEKYHLNGGIVATPEIVKTLKIGDYKNV